jgi:CubicO group peptidase (beta-lactamase class C family)
MNRSARGPLALTVAAMSLAVSAAAAPLPEASPEDVGISSQRLERILVEEGKLSLDEPISKYLPEFKDLKVGIEGYDPATGAQTFYTVPAKRQITVQDLLRHTSGFTYGTAQKTDTAFDVPAAKQGRIAQAQVDPATGKVAELLDVTQPATFFAGGHGLTSTAGDYLRFAQMLANGGELEGVRILGSRTIAFMASDHVLGAGISRGSNWIPGNGYGFGLGFAVRREAGSSEWPSSVGELFWAGYAGTYFWIDPKEQLVPVFMSQEPNRRQHYRVIMRDLVYQSLVD